MINYGMTELLSSFLVPEDTRFYAGLISTPIPLYHYSSIFNYPKFPKFSLLIKDSKILTREKSNKNNRLLVALNTGTTANEPPVMSFGERETSGEVELVCIGTGITQYPGEEEIFPDKIILSENKLVVRFLQAEIRSEPDIVYYGFYIRSKDVIASGFFPSNEYEKVKIRFVPEITFNL